MSISTTIGEVTAAIPEDTSQTVTVIGYASGATVNTIYDFSSPGAIQAAIGDGSATWLAVLIAKASKRLVKVLVPSSSGGSAGSVTETPAARARRSRSRVPPATASRP